MSGSYLSDTELLAIQHLPRTSPYLITGVSQSQLSVARQSGGCKYKGDYYWYSPQTDELIRDDVLELVTRLRRRAATRAQEEARANDGQAQGELL